MSASSAQRTDGEHVWEAANRGSGNALGRVKGEEIVFVLAKPDASQGYEIFTLTEGETSGVAGDGDAQKTQPFQLTSVSVPDLPLGVLDQHLLQRQVPAHLACHAHHQLHVIVSTGSGTGKALPFYDSVLRPLVTALGLHEEGELAIPDPPEPPKAGDAALGTTHGYQVTVTRDSQSVRQFARRLRNPIPTDGDRPDQTIILLSGDGGVVDLLNGLDEASGGSQAPRPTIALLPLGTGNALFHSLHRPLYAADGTSSFVLGLRTLFKGTTAPLPTFRATFSPRSRLVSHADRDPAQDSPRDPRHDPADGPPVDHLLGAIVASYGFHASLVWESDTPSLRRHGAARFGMAAQELLREAHTYQAEVQIRRSVESDMEALPRSEFNYVLATLVSSLEKTFTISPASAPLDGRLRLVHFGAVGAERTMEIMMAAYDGGRHVGMSWNDGARAESVGYEEVEAVRLAVRETDPRWRKVCVDGTIVEVGEEGWMAVGRTPESELLLHVLVDGSLLSRVQSV